MHPFAGASPSGKIRLMRAYSDSHLLWLAGIAGMSCLLATASRRAWVPKPLICWALASLLMGGEIQRFFTDGIAFPDRVPLHLCNVTTWVAVFACLALSPVACEFAYFWGITGAGMAVLTPDMGAPWPPRFFVNHGALILTGVTLAGGHIMPIRRGAIARAYGLFLLYIGLVGLYNWRFGTNFAFLAHKPAYPTLIDLLGPWPLYLGSEGLLGLALLNLLWLPLRHRAGPASSDASEHVHRFSAPQTTSGQPSGAGSQ